MVVVLLRLRLSVELVRIVASYTAAWMYRVFRGMEGEPLLQSEEAERFLEASTVLGCGF